jgi:hypothetical protein
MAVAMVILLGFAGLAIDGGNLLAQRRHAQGAVDNAALAYGLAMSREEWEDPESLGKERAEDTLTNSGYVDFDNDVDNASTTVLEPNQVDIVIGSPSSNTITISLTKRVPTAFIHFVYGGLSQYTVRAIARGEPESIPFSGFGLVSFGTVCDTGANNSGIGATGGGISGGINVYGLYGSQPAMLVNADVGTSDCYYRPPSNGTGITAEGGLYAVGDWSGSGLTVNNNYNGGVTLADPMANVAMPQCLSDGVTNPGGSYEYGPGNWDGDDLGWGDYAPGIYCISGDIDPSGNGTINAASNVLFVMINGGISLSGDSSLVISSVNDDDALCDGYTDSPSTNPYNICSYTNLALYAPGQTVDPSADIIDIGGNSGGSIEGTLYAPFDAVQANGGGSNPEETRVVGQLMAGQVLNNGNGSLVVIYDETRVFIVPASMQLIE